MNPLKFTLKCENTHKDYKLTLAPKNCSHDSQMYDKLRKSLIECSHFSVMTLTIWNLFNFMICTKKLSWINDIPSRTRSLTYWNCYACTQLIKFLSQTLRKFCLLLNYTRRIMDCNARSVIDTLSLRSARASSCKYLIVWLSNSPRVFGEECE